MARYVRRLATAASTTIPTQPSAPGADPRRWLAAGAVIVSVLIPVLDNTILFVAVPTIQREFRTELTSLQWVITGYSLTFATLLIIGGRLGDMFGHRRTFMIGVAIFGCGSFLASVSNSVPTLFLGEALIEGIGASLMLPATLSILSTTFAGRERALAFAAWGTVAGAAVAFGPLVGGLLTTNYSWRWAFRINVIVAPVILLAAWLFMRRDEQVRNRPKLDAPGAALIALGSFSLVFGLSEGGSYGWWRPVRDMTLGGATWPRTDPVSFIPFSFLAAAVFLSLFVVVERRKERRGRDPLFEFGQLQHLSFRYGLLTTMVLAMGQFALIFVIPVVLQDGEHLSALRTGVWMLPMGVLIALAAPLGGRLTARISVTAVVRTGLACEFAGLVAAAIAVSRHMTFLALLPASVIFGVGVGFASSQLTNVVLSDIDAEKVGVASGTNTTVRQVGIALGIAVFAAFINARGVAGARTALLFAAVVVGIGTGLSLLIPRVSVAREPAFEAAAEALSATTAPEVV